MAAKPEDLSNVKVLANNLDELHVMLHMLGSRELLVGFPETTTERKPEDGAGLGVAKDITNAALGYIHDTGMPEQNIPARPFMLPGMNNAIPEVIVRLEAVAKRILRKANKDDVEKGFMRVGVAVQFAIRAKINEGIPPPLADATLEERARKGRKGAKEELANRALGLAPSTQLAKPLIDTGQLRNAVNFVIRPRKQRK